jgi:hypothetical protein
MGATKETGMKMRAQEIKIKCATLTFTKKEAVKQFKLVPYLTDGFSRP